MNVPLVDLRASLTPIKQQLFEQFESILDSMQLMFGPNVQAFEREFAALLGVEHGISLANGTDAIFVALEAMGIGPGDEVIAPALTFFATIEAICHAGAVPVLADVNPDTLTIDPRRIEALVSDKTKAIVPVHLYGLPADMDPILNIAKKHGLKIVEDCAQAHGAVYRGRVCGGMGDASAFSFYFTKNLGAFGEAGFTATNDAGLAERLRRLRHHGHVTKFEHAEIGYNLRMDELQAAVLRLKLPLLAENNERRRRIAARYDAAFKNMNIQVLKPRSDGTAVYHLYPIRVTDRDGLAVHLADRGVGTGIHYKIPAHRQPAMQRVPHRCGPMDVTEDACLRMLSLPIYPELTEPQQQYVIEQVAAFVEG